MIKYLHPLSDFDTTRHSLATLSEPGLPGILADEIGLGLSVPFFVPALAGLTT